MVERLNNATGALGALRYLQSATKDLSGAESRLSSGLKVSRARDDATSYHSAAIMRGQGSSLNAVTLSLGRAESISDTAMAAAEQISKQLGALKATATQAMSEGLTADQRTAFQNQYNDQMQTLQMFIRNASFDDANVLDGSKVPGGVSFIADAEGLQSVTLEGRNFMPGGPVIVAPPATNGLANTQAAADLRLDFVAFDDELREVSVVRGERAELDGVAVGEVDELGVLDAVLVELGTGHRHGQRAAVHRRLVLAQRPEHEGQGPEVVLVAVGDDDRLDVLGVVAQVGEVRQDEVDPRLLRRGEAQPDVDDDDPVVVLDDRHVLADLPESAEGKDAQLAAHERCAPWSGPAKAWVIGSFRYSAQRPGGHGAQGLGG